MSEPQHYWHLLAGHTTFTRTDADPAEGEPVPLEIRVSAVAGPSSRDADWVNPATGRSMRFGIAEGDTVLHWVAQWDHEPTEQEIEDALDQWDDAPY